MIKYNKKKVGNMKVEILGLSSPARFKLKELKSGLKVHQKIWENAGFDPVLSDSCFVQNYYQTVSGYEKAKELTAVCKQENNIIVPLRGGYSTNFMLEYLNINELSKKKQMIVGHSDLTILLNLLAKNTNWDVWHGPLFTSVAADDKYTLSTLMGVLTDKISVVKSQTMIASYHAKIIEGEIYGGNLSLITGAIGTEYEIDFTNKIVLIEDVNEPDFKIDAMMFQLTKHYDLSKVKGFIIGSFIGCHQQMNEHHRGVIDIIKGYLLVYKLPIMFNYSSSHDPVMTPIKLGKTVQVNFKTSEIKLF